MIRILSTLALCSILWMGVSSCNKECKPKPVSAEADALMAYAASNGLTDVQSHSSGLYYQIVNPGSGASATADSYIKITYVGKFLDGEIFDQQSSANTTPWPLAGLIEGWRIGIPLIKEGGHIRLLVPSALAYGCEGRGVISGNTPLFFDVQLVDVEP